MKNNSNIQIELMPFKELKSDISQNAGIVTRSRKATPAKYDEKTSSSKKRTS